MGSWRRKERIYSSDNPEILRLSIKTWGEGYAGIQNPTLGL